MSEKVLDSQSDPVVARLLRVPTGLRAGGVFGTYEALASYWNERGGCPFAFCRDGLLIDPQGEARFVRFLDIEDSSYWDKDLLLGEKRARIRGTTAEASLPLRLAGGETIVLPLRTRADRGSDRQTIARLIEQRVVIARSRARRKLTGD
jgi:hypothetical protein